MSQSPNRTQRRAYLKSAGILKAKNQLNLQEWSSLVSENIKKGRELHEQNTDFYDKQIADQLQIKENSMVSTWKEMGYSQEQIDKFLESWYDVVFRNRNRKADASA
jgi:DNA-binding transcriptional regulator YhcF (GntR family)